MKLSNTILTTIEIAATGFTIYAAYRSIAGPDATRTSLMKGASTVEDFCEHQARMWAGLADRAQVTYNDLRNSSVM